MSDETKQTTDETQLEVEAVAEDQPKTLHELNMEQQTIDAQLREVNEAAAKAAAKATLGVLNNFRSGGKRTQKPVRATVTE